ncbi:MAG: endonuclease domain-containing protein [Anaerolineae bacterium]|nr:endonuclease domain-containing protein [Anaerolineae bacterium]
MTDPDKRLFPQFTGASDQWENLKAYAREMRHQPTPAESHLWRRLRGRRVGGMRIRRQYAIAGFIVDFVCLERFLIIEVDGSIHDLPDQQERDALRQAYLESLGYRVLRFTNSDVLGSVDAVLEVIGAALAEDHP